MCKTWGTQKIPLSGTFSEFQSSIFSVVFHKYVGRKLAAESSPTGLRIFRSLEGKIGPQYFRSAGQALN